MKNREKLQELKEAYRDEPRRIRVRAYGKINLCLDVPGLLPNGYHEVNMIMQQILLCDDLTIRWTPEGEEGSGRPEGSEDSEDKAAAPAGIRPSEAGGSPSEDEGRPSEDEGKPSEDEGRYSEAGERTSEDEGRYSEAEGSPSGVRISVGTNRPYLPTDRRNLAWQAAEKMAGLYGRDRRGQIRIDILKRIPVAAGLAGGSSNCAAVLHGINRLWDLGLSLSDLCRIGGQLGSDVPFCVMGQAAADEEIAPAFAGDPLACHCAVATGRGTDLRPIPGLRSDLVLSKPPISVSTAEAYRGVDEAVIPDRPQVEEMAAALARGDLPGVEKNMVNVLENFTLKRYAIVVYTKDKMQELCKPRRVLMSGSGPTVYGLCGSREEAKEICRQMKEINRESFWTRTTW